MGTRPPRDGGVSLPGVAKALIEERHKAGMVNAGRWRATRPEVQGHAGFRLNALVSLLAECKSWSKLAAEFLQAKDDPAELQTFVNTILGQGWREAGAEIDDAALQARAEPFGLDAIPADVLVLTAGVDVQDDRLEITIAGWTRDGTALVLGHIVIWGSPDDDTTWLELDELLKTRWTHPLGGKLRIDAAAIDSGDGDWTDKVYSFCLPARRPPRDGDQRGERRATVDSGVASGKVKGGRLWLVGVDTDQDDDFLALAARGIRSAFRRAWTRRITNSLASERRVVRYSRGKPVRRFERIPGKRAEALDALVYAFAARSAAPIQLDQRLDELRSPTPLAPPPHVIKSRWMARDTQ